jgi:tetratricopeptide (TPR) repeat protein
MARIPRINPGGVSAPLVKSVVKKTPPTPTNPPPNRSLQTAVIAACIVVVVLIGVLGWRTFDTRRATLAAIPMRPEIAQAHPELRERTQTAEQRARSWFKPADGLAELARLYHANGLLGQAGEAYRVLMDVDPREARWPYLRADILAGYGQLDEAVPLLRRAVSLAPEYAPARSRLDEALLKINQPAETARTRGAVPSVGGGASGATNAPASREGKPADPWLDDLLSDCYDAYRLRVAAASAQDTALAERWLARATHVAPQDAAAYRQWGDLLTKTGDYPRAREHLERAVELGPKEADNWAYLLRLLDLAGDTAAGDRALASGLMHCPQSPSLHLERGRRLKRAGQFEPALVAFETSRRLRPQDIDAYVELSGVYFRLERVDEGIAALRAALQVEPAHPVALSTLAFCAIGIGDKATAQQALHDARAQPRVARTDLDQLIRRFGERFGHSPW